MRLVETSRREEHLRSILTHSTNTYMSGTVVGTGDRVRNETDEVHVLLKPKFYWESKTITRQTNK